MTEKDNHQNDSVEQEKKEENNQDIDPQRDPDKNDKTESK
ncbi:3-methyladenine DNA glycosylase [Peribacillus sp. SCS-26]